MDMITLGMQALEAAIHAGSSVINGIDQIVQAAPEEPNITCELCRCDW